jgi:hypothetical protein
VSVGAELFILLLIASTTYAAGRVHAKVGYRFGYRFGYRQGYFDGDRASWNRRRRDAQTAISAVLSGKQGRDTFSLVPHGTTYTSTSATGRHALDRRGSAG